MSDLRDRVPGHSLIDELLRQWDIGTIHIDETSNGIVIDEEAEGWYRGVLGERKVAAILSQLSEDWTVLHSVPVGSGMSDIDHVVIGPSGVFTINTKFSPGKDVWVAGRGMYVGGSKQPYVTNMLHEARRASNFLSRASGLTVPVTGLIVFVDPAKITHKAVAGGGEYDPPVKVIRQTDLLNEFLARPEFSLDQIARISAAAIDGKTWSVTASASSNASHISREFAALEQAVGPRLQLPRARSSAVQPDHPTRSTTRKYSAPYGAPRSPSRRRPKKSGLERLVTELAFPVVGLVILWFWLQNR
jgi:hypothetical protein